MRTRIVPALLVAVAVIAVAAVAAGCGSDDEPASRSASGNATDAAFISDMTAHHEGAIEMARIAQGRADHREIRELADDIVAAQQSEISAMRTIRDGLHEAGEHGDGHMGMDEEAMGMDMDPSELERATPFDRAFIDAMIPHHEGAIAMSRRLLEKGEHPRLREMADEIIAAQSREIAQMREWRKAWYGSAEPSADDPRPHRGSADAEG